MNIERDKSGGVGQIPELRRGSLVAALSHLSVRRGGRGIDWTEGQKEVDGLDPPLTLSDCPDQSAQSQKIMEKIIWNICYGIFVCWCKLFSELLTFVGIGRS